MSRLESDFEVLDSTEEIERIEVAAASQCENDLISNTMDESSQPVMANGDESVNMSSNLSSKDSSVDVDSPSSLSAVDKLSSSQPVDLPMSQCSRDVCQPEAVPEQQNTSQELNEDSSLVMINSQSSTDQSQEEDSVSTDKPSTVIVISSHQNKGAPTVSQPDLDRYSAGVAESDSHLHSVNDDIPQSSANLFMCCSDDTSATESCDDPVNDEEIESVQKDDRSHSAGSSMVGSKNEAVGISNNKPNTECTHTLKRQITVNGMAYLHFLLY